MPDLAPFHGLFVFAHVLGVFLFLLAHGVSAAVMLRLRGERDLVALRTLLDLSRRTFTVMLSGFLIWLFGGLLAGFSGNFWTTGRYWIWASLAVGVLVVGIMTPLGRGYFERLRGALGIDRKTGALDPGVIVDPAAVEAVIAAGRPMLLAAIGVGGVVALSWLMMFKPF